MSFTELGLFFNDSTGEWESGPVPDMSPAGRALRKGASTMDFNFNKPAMGESSDVDLTALGVTLGPGTWDDVEGAIELRATLKRVTFLRSGTRKGNPSVELLFQLRDGRYVHASTTWALWQGATLIFTEEAEHDA